MPWQKGQSGNPKGGPRKNDSLAGYIRSIGGDDGKVYADKLHEIATGTHDNVAARLAAINALFDRGWGKPPQDVNLGNQDDQPLRVVHEQLP